jgi:sarcosine oxidase subunit gamma
VADPARQGALARLGLAGMAAAGAPAAVRLGWREPATQLGLRGDATDSGFTEAAAAALGFALPVVPNTTAGAAGTVALWLGPSEWLLVGAVEAEPLAAALAERHAAVVDLSCARTLLTVAGERTRELLAKACSLDLHPRAFGVGACAQSRFARTSALLHCRGEHDFDVHVGRSYAVYAWQWLWDAAQEYGVAVAGLDEYS